MSRAFDGSGTISDSNNDKAVLASHNVAYDNLRAFTRAVWVYMIALGGTNAGVILAKDIQGITSPFLSLEEGTSSRKLACYTTTSSFANTATVTTNALNFNQWYHIAFTFDADGDNLCHIYINGVEASYDLRLAGDGTIVDDSGVGSGSGDGKIYIGGDLLFHEWNGYIAEVAIWNVVLTPAQIAALAASTTGAASIASANLRAYWHLCGVSSPEPDSSGNGNSGILTAHIPIQGPNSPGFGCGAPPILPPDIFAPLPFGDRLTACAAVFACIGIASPAGAQRIPAPVLTLAALSLSYAQLLSVYALLINTDTANLPADLNAAINTAVTVVGTLNTTIQAMTATRDAGIALAGMKVVVANALTTLQKVAQDEFGTAF